MYASRTVHAGFIEQPIAPGWNHRLSHDLSEICELREIVKLIFTSHIFGKRAKFAFYVANTNNSESLSVTWAVTAENSEPSVLKNLLFFSLYQF